jgi:CheY-like chemotaxis protein
VTCQESLERAHGARILRKLPHHNFPRTIHGHFGHLATRSVLPPAVHSAASAELPNTAGTPRVVVLCVERDPHVRELEAYFLREGGFEVRFAADGLEALELARTLRPAIVITEILLPKLDGLALCRRLKTDPATQQTAVLVFSLLAAAGRAHDAGADAFLSKPLAAQRLTETVRTLLSPLRHGPGEPSLGQAEGPRLA